MTLIIAFSGKKQSGKTTSGHFIMSLCMSKLDIAKKIDLNEYGDIIVSDLLGNDNYKGIYSPEKISYDTNDYIIQQAQARLDPYIKLYSFADPLKQSICMDILGLTWDQCYGSDEEKNSLTSLRWQDMPGYELLPADFLKNKNSDGYMTAREIMEHIGTDIFRKISTNVWADATIRRIQKDKPKIAVITDCRFPNEIDAIKKINGIVIRLTKSPYKSEHISENVLDKEVYDWSNFNYILDNENISIYEQCLEIQKALKEVISL